MHLSYAQNLEDYHLAQAFAGERAGFYIDIGAGHPVADNVSFHFYREGWRGIIVEPQSDLCTLYGQVRPRDTAFCGVVGRSSGEVAFHAVEKLHGFSTTIEANAAGAQQFGAGYRTITVPALTLAELCARHVAGPIDFLKIDVEGAEADVLMSGDWRRFRPKVVLAEAIAPGAATPNWEGWEPYLLAQGYRFVLFDNLNRFYVAEEQTALLDRFPKTQADWGAVKHFYEVGRAGDNAAHPDHTLALELARGFWASLPELNPALLGRLLARGRGQPATDAASLLAELSGDESRTRLGRIAACYDGGQLYDD